MIKVTYRLLLGKKKSLRKNKATTGSSIDAQKISHASYTINRCPCCFCCISFTVYISWSMHFFVCCWVCWRCAFVCLFGWHFIYETTDSDRMYSFFLLCLGFCCCVLFGFLKERREKFFDYYSNCEIETHTILKGWQQYVSSWRIKCTTWTSSNMKTRFCVAWWGDILSDCVCAREWWLVTWGSGVAWNSLFEFCSLF